MTARCAGWAHAGKAGLLQFRQPLSIRPPSHRPKPGREWFVRDRIFHSGPQIAQCLSRCCKCLNVSSTSSWRRSPQDSRMASSARPRFVASAPGSVHGSRIL
jgi:hypothetical protein